MSKKKIGSNNLSLPEIMNIMPAPKMKLLRKESKDDEIIRLRKKIKYYKETVIQTLRQKSNIRRRKASRFKRMYGKAIMKIGKLHSEIDKSIWLLLNHDNGCPVSDIDLGKDFKEDYDCIDCDACIRRILKHLIERK